MKSNNCNALSPARQSLTRLPRPSGQGDALVGSVSVARVPPRTSKGITAFLPRAHASLMTACPRCTSAFRTLLQRCGFPQASTSLTPEPAARRRRTHTLSHVATAGRYTSSPQGRRLRPRRDGLEGGELRVPCTRLCRPQHHRRGRGRAATAHACERGLAARPSAAATDDHSPENRGASSGGQSCWTKGEQHDFACVGNRGDAGRLETPLQACDGIFRESTSLQTFSVDLLLPQTSIGLSR